jgi:ADP-ribose pyrophosphatase YjhB (NUDIX family)
VRLPDPRQLPYALLRLFPPPPPLYWRLARLANDSFLVGVSGVVANETGRVLFFHHTYRADPWGLPGGWMRRGESPFAAFEREVAEESGIVVRAERLLLIGAAPDRPKLDFVVGGTLVGGSFRPSREVDAHRWARPEELPLSGFSRLVVAECARLGPNEVGRIAIPWSAGVEGS